VLRALCVLLALAGVLAMLALSGGSHMASTVGGSQPARSVAVGESSAAALNVMSGMATTRAGLLSRMSGPPATTSASPGVAAACVAVLLGLALLVVRATVDVPRLRDRPASAGAGHSSARLGRVPSRQLLAQICVLRT